MMVAMRKITEHRVRSWKPEEKRRTVAEDGLQVEIHPSGRKTFYFKFRQGGKQHKEKLGDYHPDAFNVKAAREKVRELQSKLITDGAVHQSSQTLEQFLDGRWKSYILDARVRGQETYDRVHNHFVERRPVIGKTPLRKLTHEQFDLWVTAMKRELAPASINKTMGDLKSALNKAVEWDLLRRSPAEKVKPLPVDSESDRLYLSEAEMKRLKKALESWEHTATFGTKRERRDTPLWFVLYMHIALNTGARPREILTLEWADIDHTERVITFRGPKTKNRKTRRLPISDGLADRLKSFMPDHEESEEVFSVSSIRKPWAKLMKQAKIDAIPYITRHHVLSQLVLKGTPLNVVRDIAGHHNISVTSRYLSVRTDDKLEALNLL